MTEQTLDELKEQSSQNLNKIFSQITQRQAENVIHRQLENLTKEGKVLLLSSEEEKLLASFRRFKARIKKNAAIFTWQTRRIEGIIEAPDQFFIENPQEVVE